jgi:hypothetical protein
MYWRLSHKDEEILANQIAEIFRLQCLPVAIAPTQWLKGKV